MRTTLTLDPDVAAKLTTESKRLGLSFKEIVNRVLRLGLNTKRELEKPHPFHIKPIPMGLKAGFQIDNIGEILERLEGPEHR